MGSGKTPNGARTVYGTCAGIVSLGQLDFVWGIMVNNILVWPGAEIWLNNSWQPNQVVVFGGDAYQTLISTTADPPNPPWNLYCHAWAAGTYAANSVVVRGVGLWQTLAMNALAPPATPPQNQWGTGAGLFSAPIVNGWVLLGLTTSFTTSATWAANSIVAWKGRLYSTPSLTAAEPPAAPWVLWKQPRAANPLKLTIPNMGDAYLYWGTDTQVLDTVNEQTLNTLGHPAYRSRAVLVIKDFLFGTETTTPPDINVLGGRSPVQTLITGAATNMDADWQVNPWCVLAEMLTHPIIGLGLPNSMFDAATWQSEADRCAASPNLYYISPVYTSLVKVRDLVSELMGYPDSFVFWNVLGKIQAGHWPHGDAAPAFDNTNVVNRDTLISELSGNTEGWGATANSVEVSYDDIQAGFKNRTAIAPNLFNRAIIKRLQSQRVDKPHIVRQAQAIAWASEMAKIAGDQTADYQSECRAERLTGVQPGSLFEVTDDVLQTSQTHRCLSKTISAPPKGTIKLTHQLERGVSPLPYSPTPSLISPTGGVGPKPITDYQFVQLPSALGGGPSRIACLAARSENVTNIIEMFYKNLDTNSFQQLGTIKGFGVAGVLSQSINTQGFTTLLAGTVTQGNTYDFAQTYPWNVVVLYDVGGGVPGTTATETDDYIIDYVAGTVAIVTGGAITTGSKVRVSGACNASVTVDANVPLGDIEAISTSQTADQVADNTLLMFIFNVATPAQFEICAVTAVTASGGNYLFNLKRTQYASLLGGDGSYVFTTGDVAVAVFRRDIVPLFHASFPKLQRTAGVVNFVIAPGSPFGQAEVDDIYDPTANPNGLATEATYTFNNNEAPSISFGAELVNGAAINFATEYLQTDIFEITATVADAEGDFYAIRFFLASGESIIELGNRTYSPTRSRTFHSVFVIPKDGTWQGLYTLTDLAGNVKTYPLCATGGTTAKQITIDSSSGTIVVAPFADPPGDNYGATQHITLTTPTAGATIHYSLVALGAAHGAWTTYTVPVRVPLLSNASRWSLYAYASKGGMTDSGTSRTDFIYEANL